MVAMKASGLAFFGASILRISSGQTCSEDASCFDQIDFVFEFAKQVVADFLMISQIQDRGALQRANLA